MPRPKLPGRLLAGMRIRKKLIFLHTFFSLVLAGILLTAVWPAITRVVQQAEFHEARFALSVALGRIEQLRAERPGEPFDADAALSAINAALPEGVSILRGPLERFGVSPEAVAAQGAGAFTTATLADGTEAPFAVDPADRSGYVATARLDEARAGVKRLLWMMTFALLGIYGLIAVALEVFILPEHVYQPIQRLLEADRAVRENDRGRELIPATAMPADEIGEIMRSRNQTVEALRAHEQALAGALRQLEEAATDLKRKNHLLEAARRNLADADRLASLGIMSAGLAHELNTPLAVIKGLVERLASSPEQRLDPAESALLLRVVQRLERLSDSLLDFARVRPPESRIVAVRPLVDEAWTLVRLDREARGLEFVNSVAADVLVRCDADRIVQVLVNLLRNAVDACGGATGRIEAAARIVRKDDARWLSLTVSDTGPGLDPAIVERLFEPFASTRLDARGTGLGLAVSEGIVREHGGLLLARNRAEGSGAVFEVLLPGEPSGNDDGAPETLSGVSAA
ncbi:MAG: HAMP domain-containing histidine kinase [Phycisphaerae bacterium]|nr:HAMP domain-containing histidine kinase [Phycisphaerae bacterium]